MRYGPHSSIIFNYNHHISFQLHIFQKFNTSMVWFTNKTLSCLSYELQTIIESLAEGCKCFIVYSFVDKT